MNKPNFYDEQTAGSNYTPFEPGPHKLVIKKVEETKNKNGGDMIIVSFDTADTDSQPKYFTEKYKNDTRDDKKWGGRAWINVLDYEGKTSKSFKGFCTSVEESNANFNVIWGDKFASCFTGKMVGGVFGEEEYLKNDGTVGISVKHRFWRNINKVMEEKVPDKRVLDTSVSTSPSSNSIPDGFELLDESDLPF